MYMQICILAAAGVSKGVNLGDLKIHGSGMDLDVSENRGIPKWMVFFMENPIKIDDLGVPLFLETPISFKFTPSRSYSKSEILGVSQILTPIHSLFFQKSELSNEKKKVV